MQMFLSMLIIKTIDGKIIDQKKKKIKMKTIIYKASVICNIFLHAWKITLYKRNLIYYIYTTLSLTVYKNITI